MQDHFGEEHVLRTPIYPQHADFKGETWTLQVDDAARQALILRADGSTYTSWAFADTARRIAQPEFGGTSKFPVLRMEGFFVELKCTDTGLAALKNMELSAWRNADPQFLQKETKTGWIMIIGGVLAACAGGALLPVVMFTGK